MSGNNKVIRTVVALAIGIFLALFSYQRITDHEPGQERVQEAAAVLGGRDILRELIGTDVEIEIVDPLAPNRVIGKAYIYPAESGWQLSGYYRRTGNGSSDRWHPYLMTLDHGLTLVTLSVKDANAQLTVSAGSDPRISVNP